MTARKRLRPAARIAALTRGAVLAVAIGTTTATTAQATALEFRLGTGSDATLEAALEQGSLLASTLADAQAAASAQDLIAAAQADYQRLIAVLYEAGYFGAELSISIDGQEAVTLSPLDHTQRIDEITITVDTGPAYQFAEATIGPLPETSGSPALPDGFASGAVAGTGVIRAAAKAGVAAWRAAGHPLARMAAQDITAQHQDRTLSARLTLEAGPAAEIAQPLIGGNMTTRSTRIAQIAGLRQGNRYDPKAIDQAAARLRDSGTFRSVVISEGEALDANGQLPIDIQVSEQLPRRYGLGAEVSTAEGLTLSGFWMHRNLLGGAENLRIDAEIAGLAGETGGIDTSIDATLRRPATFTSKIDIVATAEVMRLDEPDFRLDQMRAGVSFERDVTATLTLSAGVSAATARATEGATTRSYSFAALPIKGLWEQRDDRNTPREGLFGTLEITPFAGVGDLDSGLRLFSEGRYYLPLGDAARPQVMALRAQAGAVMGADATRAPTDYLFHSGGSDTVRGQPYQALGADLAGDGASGAGAFAALSAEWRQPLNGAFDMVGFADIGWVAADVTGSNSDWHAGAGLGLRYDTGIGPIRLDVATPLGKGETGKGVSLYVGIGQAF